MRAPAADARQDFAHHAQRARRLSRPERAVPGDALSFAWSSSATAPDELEVTAESDDGLIMAVAHRDLPVHGVQFHPESIASEHGRDILRNFLDLAAAFHARQRSR